MRIDKEFYSKQNWIIHRLANDFELEDCWLLPIRPRNRENSFVELFEFVMSFNPAEANIIVGLLFRIRLTIGSLMKWDGSNNWANIPGTSQKSLRERLSKSEEIENQINQLKCLKDMMSEFKVVYLFDNEGLLEISNQTIFALLHVGLSKEEKVVLGVMIKSRGSLSDFYMKAIKPFRHYIVYPYWFEALEVAWNEKLKNTS